MRSQSNIFEQSTMIIEQIEYINTKPFNSLLTNNHSIYSIVYKIQIISNQITHKNQIIDNNWLNRNNNNGISIYSLIQFGIHKSQKKLLYQLLIELPLWSTNIDVNELYPWELYIHINQSQRNNNIKQQNKLSQQSLNLTLIYISDINFDTKSQTNNNNINTKSHKISVTFDKLNLIQNYYISQIYYQIINNELMKNSAEIMNGIFSLIEHNSGYGYLSIKLAKKYYNATIISLEKNYHKIMYHYNTLQKLSINNNAICYKDSLLLNDELIYKHIYESPELFRYQIIINNLFETYINNYINPTSTSSSSNSYYKPLQSTWGVQIGEILSSALTTFIKVPLASQVSLATVILYKPIYRSIDYLFISNNENNENKQMNSNDIMKKVLQNNEYYDLSFHPMKEYINFEENWLLQNIKVGLNSNTQLKLQLLTYKTKKIPLIRCDIINMTRLVHHHYDYNRDGHTRTYTMKISINSNETYNIKQYYHKNDISNLYTISNNSIGTFVSINQPNNYILNSNKKLNSKTNSKLISNSNVNSNANFNSTNSMYRLLSGNHINQDHVMSVGIYRDKDNIFIPYNTIYGITLISVLRMGLIAQQRDNYFHSFLKLNLYEDMAPWNIVLMGQVSCFVYSLDSLLLLLLLLLLL